MKKHKGIYAVGIGAVVFLIIGAGLIGGGIVAGGSLRYLNVNKFTVSWWPFSFGNVGIGIFDYDDDDNRGVSTYHKAIDNIKQIKVDCDAGDIEIRRGNTNQITYKTRSKNYISINENNGVLDVQIDHENLLHMGNVKEEVIIQLKDDVYNSIKVSSSLGDITIQDVRTKNLDINATLGEMSIDNVYSENTIVSQDCGDIELSGILLGETKVINRLGDSDVEITGDINEYRYTVNNSLGDTSVLDNDHDGMANISGGNNTAKNYIDIKNSLGDIEFDIQ